MYKCPECERKFDYPDYTEVCLEDLNGVGSMFYDKHYGVIAECPYCGEAIDLQEDEISDDYE